MQDRMTVSAQTWRTDAPPINQVVEVWHYTSVVLAVRHDGMWRTLNGEILVDITHWRPYHA